MYKTFLATLLVTVISIGTSSAALADGKIAKKLQSAKISLQEAIGIAEQAVGGRAYKAKLDKNSFGSEYEVDLLVEDNEVEVSVDAQSAEVLKIRVDKD